MKAMKMLVKPLVYNSTHCTVVLRDLSWAGVSWQPGNWFCRQQARDNQVDPEKYNRINKM